MVNCVVGDSARLAYELETRRRAWNLGDGEKQIGADDPAVPCQGQF